MKATSLTGLSIALGMMFGAQSAMTAPNIDAQSSPAVVSAASSNATVSFRIFLPLRNQAQLDSLISELHDSTSSNYQQWLTPDEFMQQFGPTATDLATLKRSVLAQGLTIINEDAHGLRVQGPASAVAKTFGVSIQKKSQGTHTHFMTNGAPRLPSDLAALNARVVGLEKLPERHVHAHLLSPMPISAPDNRYDEFGGYWFDDLKQAYDYPAYQKNRTDGSGVTVAVLMSDLLYPGDIAAAFNHEKFTQITGVAPPKVSTVKIDGGGVEGGDGSVEASLDVQEILGGAPGAQVTLVSIPDLSNDSVLDGYTYIVDRNAYDLVNSSFGGCELEYTAADNEGVDYTYVLTQLHEVFQQGNAQGITFVASSGDEGALDCPDPAYGFTSAPAFFTPGVENPADDPNVTGVGGGNLVTTYKPGKLNSAYVSENGYGDPEVPYDIYGVGENVSGGWWGAGGGVSQIFRKPGYQLLANTGSFGWRTVPDVGMQVGGCPQGLAVSCGADDSYVIIAYDISDTVNGGFFGLIGTSVASPEFVSSLALYEQSLGKHHRQGNVNYYLYSKGATQTLTGGVYAPSPLQYYHRNIPGFDGFYKGGFPSFNYDYIYGQGSPDVRKLFGLTEYPAAGVPQTASNP
jgi:subtilase family serine protease